MTEDMNFNPEDIINQIQAFLGKHAGNLSILEEQIDIAIQMDYFDTSRKIKKTATKPDIEKTLEQEPVLFNPETPVKDKKEILINLASSGDVRAYRVIERFNKEVDDELKDWSKIALQESRVFLESELMDESQIFISTGLGGKGHKLRYFIVITSTDKKQFNETQQKIIKNEFEFAINHSEGEIEEIDFCENYSTLLAILPMGASIKNVFQKAVNECNQFGDFILNQFIITNVKKLSVPEIQELFAEQLLSINKN